MGESYKATGGDCNKGCSDDAKCVFKIRERKVLSVLTNIVFFTHCLFGILEHTHCRLFAAWIHLCACKFSCAVNVFEFVIVVCVHACRSVNIPSKKISLTSHNNLLQPLTYSKHCVWTMYTIIPYGREL